MNSNFLKTRFFIFLTVVLLKDRFVLDGHFINDDCFKVVIIKDRFIIDAGLFVKIRYGFKSTEKCTVFYILPESHTVLRNVWCAP